MKALFFVMFAAACSSGNDGPPAVDAAGAQPIVTPDDQWTWVPIEGTTCANGSPAGIGVYRTHVTDNVFVYFQGGGACWDYKTCFVDKSSVHVETTYDQATLTSEAGALAFNRADTTNPLSQSTVVFVPYCTADLHAGDNIATYSDGSISKQVHHSGAVNTQAFVDAVHSTLPDAQTVWVAGSSAGGYAATLNFHRFTTAWSGASVHLLQDSSPFVPVLTNFSTWKTAWNLQYPPGCNDCETSFPAVVDAVATAHPSSRIGLMHFTEDSVIKFFFGYTGSLLPATNALLDNEYKYANTKAYVIAADRHTMLGELGTLVSPGGVPLGNWVLQWVRGEEGWTTVRP